MIAIRLEGNLKVMIRRKCHYKNRHYSDVIIPLMMKMKMMMIKCLRTRYINGVFVYNELVRELMINNALILFIAVMIANDN